MKLLVDLSSDISYQNGIKVMKNLFMVALVLLISTAFVCTGFAQSKAALGKAPAPGKSPVLKKQATKLKTEPSGFVGKVSMIDATMITVKGKKAIVTFDARNPKLKGYRAVGDVMIGDTVAARYSKDGVTITKMAGAKPEKLAIEKSKAKQREAPKGKESRPASVAEKKAEHARKAPTETIVRQVSCTGKNPCTVSVVKLTQVGAVIVEDYELKVLNKSKEGGSGTITSMPAGIFCLTGSSIGCEDFFPHGEEVILSALADRGSTFIGWVPASECPGTDYCIVPMDKKRTIKAAFTFSRQ